MEQQQDIETQDWWWVREDLDFLTPSSKDEDLRSRENVFVKQYLERRISFEEMSRQIKRLNNEYKKNGGKVC